MNKVLNILMKLYKIYGGLVDYNIINSNDGDLKCYLRIVNLFDEFINDVLY